MKTDNNTEFDVSPEAIAMLQSLHDQQEDLTRRLDIITQQAHVLGNVVLNVLGIVIPKGTGFYVDFDRKKIVLGSVDAKSDNP